ncbi:MAG: AmmeMemoRadiSam system radical SAM enzyme [bacterium]
MSHQHRTNRLDSGSSEIKLIDELPASCFLDADNARGMSSVQLNRRSFVQKSISLGLIACPLLSSVSSFGSGFAQDDERLYIAEADYYEKLPHKKIKCKLCPRQCVIDDSERGYCGVRENREGTYYTLVHSRLCTFHVDPIEKKPLFHFNPGTMAFSIATAGCNVNCKFCQNWEISQVRPEQVRSYHAPPDAVVSMTKKQNCLSIAYTYSEPVIFFEYMRDTSLRARSQGVKSVVITGGYIAQDPLKELCSCVDAIKVDLKAFTEEYYRQVVNGELRPVMDALVTMRKLGAWTEIVYLVVPTMNDGEKELTNLSRWVKQELGPDVPIHFTRFYPQYLMKNLTPTPVRTLERAKAIADAEGLHYVYIGNVPGHAAENTYCPGCGRIVIKREGFTVTAIDLKNGRCIGCETEVAGIWGS